MPDPTMPAMGLGDLLQQQQTDETDELKKRRKFLQEQPVSSLFAGPKGGQATVGAVTGMFGGIGGFGR